MKIRRKFSGFIMILLFVFQNVDLKNLMKTLSSRLNQKSVRCLPILVSEEIIGEISEPKDQVNRACDTASRDAAIVSASSVEI